MAHGADAAGLDSRDRPHPDGTLQVRRVLMTSDAVGGVWHYALALGAGLRARGVDVTLAVLGPSPDDAQRAAAARCVTTVVEGGWRLEWMEEPWTDVARAGEWLLELERSFQPDVVHLNGFCHGALPWRAPVLVVGHSCVRSWWHAVRGADPPSSWDRYRAEVSRGLAAALLLVAPTAAMLSALRTEYGDAGLARVIPNGCRAASALPREPSAKQNVILAAGRAWDEAKNIDALCAVAGRLPWPVCLAGDRQAPGGGWMPLAGVRELGRLDDGAMRQWYERAAIYTLPARYEPFGLSILEAAAAGCALVLGDLSSLRENWSGAAVFVPPDDRRALAEALLRLIDDPGRRRSLGERARRRARQFTIERMTGAYLRAYADLLRMRRAHPARVNGTERAHQ